MPPTSPATEPHALPLPPLPTGQTGWFDAAGQAVSPAAVALPCPSQDGSPPPLPAGDRFRVLDEAVEDRLTGLVWPRRALPEPLTLAEARQAVADWNRTAHLGFADWRLPDRRELRSLVDHARMRPALPPQHPFLEVFPGWTWTSTRRAGEPGHAWRLHLEGGRLFPGREDDYCLAWPVRGASPRLPRTGDAGDGGQGVAWPEPRFERQDELVLDRLTGLRWDRDAGGMRMTTWNMALGLAQARRDATGQPWRLPSINELESLVDASRAYPALPEGHPFRRVADAHWSATTSGFDPGWAFCLYTGKGAVGVGYKPHPEFCVWLVLGPCG